MLLAQYERMLDDKLRERLLDAATSVFGRAGGIFGGGTPEQISAWSQGTLHYRLARLRLLGRRAADNTRDARRMQAVIAAVRKVLAPPQRARKPQKQQELFAP